MTRTGPIFQSNLQDNDGEFEVIQRYVDDQGRNVTVRRLKPKMF
jgi:hypothetical protein